MNRFQSDVRNCSSRDELVNVLSTAPSVMFMIFRNDISEKLMELK